MNYPAAIPNNPDKFRQDNLQYFIDLRVDNFHVQSFRTKWLNALFHENPLSASKLRIVLEKTFKLLNDLDPKRAKPLKEFLFSRDGLFLWNETITTAETIASPLDLKEMLCNFAHNNIRPDESFLRYWYQAAENGIQNYTPRDLSIVLWSFAKLGNVPEKSFLREALKCAGKKFGDFSSIDLSQTLWSLSVFYAISGDLQFKDVAQKFYAQVPSFQNISNTNRHQLQMAALLFDFEKDQQVTTSQNEHTSPWELKLKKAFEKASLDAKKADSCYLPQLARLVDFRLVNEDHDILIEADGPCYFTHSIQGRSPAYDGGTILQTALLQKFYPSSSIIRLRYQDSRVLEERFGIDKVIESLKKLFVGISAGAYVSDRGPSERSLILKPFPMLSPRIPA